MLKTSALKEQMTYFHKQDHNHQDGAGLDFICDQIFGAVLSETWQKDGSNDLIRQVTMCSTEVAKWSLNECVQLLIVFTSEVFLITKLFSLLNLLVKLAPGHLPNVVL